MTALLHFLLALVVIFALALLVSHDRKRIRLRFIIQLIVVEAALGWFFLHSASGLALVGTVGHFFETLLRFAAQGTEFVFGGMSQQGTGLYLPWRALPYYFYFRTDWYFATLAHPAVTDSGCWHAVIKS